MNVYKGKLDCRRSVDGGWSPPYADISSQSFFFSPVFWEAQQQTWSDKPLAARRQDHWQRACRNFTCTPLGFNVDSTISFTALKFYFSVSEKEAKQFFFKKSKWKKFQHANQHSKMDFWLLLSRLKKKKPCQHRCPIYPT